MSSAKRNPANAVSFDTVLPGEAEALEGTPITVNSHGKAKNVSPRKPASRSCFMLRISLKDPSERGSTCVTACMNENVCQECKRGPVGLWQCVREFADGETHISTQKGWIGEGESGVI